MCTKIDNIKLIIIVESRDVYDIQRLYAYIFIDVCVLKLTVIKLIITAMQNQEILIKFNFNWAKVSLSWNRNSGLCVIQIHDFWIAVARFTAANIT